MHVWMWMGAWTGGLACGLRYMAAEGAWRAKKAEARKADKAARRAARDAYHALLEQGAAGERVQQMQRAPCTPPHTRGTIACKWLRFCQPPPRVASAHMPSIHAKSPQETRSNR